MKPNVNSTQRRLKRAQWKRIREVNGRFDFDKVHKVMVALNLGWNIGDRSCVPTVEELKSLAEDLLTTAITIGYGCGSISRGGFVATSKLMCNGHDVIDSLQLTFELEQSASYSPTWPNDT